MFPQACMPFAPSEKSSCRHACLLSNPKKVPADLRNIFAVGKKSPQACMPFKTSAKSLRSHHHLFRDRKVFCSAAPPSVKQNGLRDGAKIISQIGFDGVVPFGQGVMGLKSKRTQLFS